MKTFLVTGASRGLGKAVAGFLLKEGHAVIGTYNTHHDIASELEAQYPNLSMHQADFLDSQSIDSFIAVVKDKSLDGIVNSAGVFLEIDFRNFDKKAFEDTFKVNAFAPIYIVQGLSQSLKDGASIVNIASNDAMVGAIVGVAYSASKAAVINITQSLANILAERKIRVNVVAPGWMGDGMQAPEELLKLAAEYNPLKRVGSYEEVAQAVLFLLSDKSSYITGTTLVVDGGDMATNYILQKEAELQ